MSNGGKIGAPAEATPPDTSRTETTLLVVDDHQCFSDLLIAALAAVPGFRCLGTAASAVEGVAMAARLRPDVVVMDVEMPGTDGLAATRRLRQLSPETAVAVVTAHTDGEWVARAAQAGASAFIPKGGTLAEMVEVLRAARPGRMVVAPSVLRTQPTGAAARADGPCVLTARELEVLGYIGRGLQAKAVAKVMGISVHTCRGYIKTVYAKLQVSSRIEAVNRARQLQLLDS